MGILFMNINDTGASMNASFGDVRHLGWSAPDRVAWWLRAVFADGTARGVLEMLFGVGMVILTARFAERGGEGAALLRYGWRNAVLFALGIAHVLILLWPGDILHTYAIAALLIFPLRHARPRLLLTLGLSLATLQLVGGGLGYMDARQEAIVYRTSTAHLTAHEPLTREERAAVDHRAERDRRLAKEMRAAVEEDAARTGTAMQWVQYQWRQAWTLQAEGLEPFVVLEAWATMLIGAALFKLGWLQGEQSARWYGRAALIVYALALVLRVTEATESMSFMDAPHLSDATSEYGRLSMSLGHVLLVNWLLASGRGGRWLRPFAAAGRSALSLYILQTLVMLWLLFPPWGLRLYGQFGWASLMVLAAVIDTALLVLAVWWMRRFRIAPVEWAWRSIVAGRALPFRRTERG
ncbi:DUF418 domain-containing protein [Sphingomonas gellani]|nr:DUF418 domain-containing protein [Sphingomonas gellani]